ncbi:SAM-dependent DNA methyltransferase (plasmid) [Bermanella marisrubri]|uniref:DNA methylase adenine-specific domain-containing protein n=1 Tax=Bermanella marisrubri TaxID=207949 RepID=Q1MY17_9GAMM|nr:N-6 DNA methylase [Bermanella marisrubri]EAT10879.1 hypothetical protein RED65_02033 [Oceanobacter sp. RED65] [Bermanella marisrubri]QIZ85931.1 SAM-dependent DNA methyltransferase [Bermanella marisrubri]
MGSQVDTFIKAFNQLVHHRNKYDVFKDFVYLSSISIQNAFLKSQELEGEYLELISKYNKDESLVIASLLGEVIIALEGSHSDFLGAVYMELDIGSSHIGQFFTPYDVSRMMAKAIYADSFSLLEEKPFLTLCEPCVGAGSMVIAIADEMLSNGFNPQNQLWVSCVDIDPLAARMAFIQLSLLGIPAEVIVGNTLTMKVTEVFRTPMHFIGFWDSKLSKLNEDVSLVEPDSIINVEKDQYDLFSLVS